MNKLSILFTSVGRRIELLKLFKSSLKKLNVDGNIVGVDINNMAPGLHIVDYPYLVPRIDSDDYIPELIKIVNKHKVDLIFPLIDTDIPILGKYKNGFKEVGAKVVLSPFNSLKICRDKWLTYNFFKNHNIPTPESWLPKHIKEIDLKYPVFIKPRSGSAAKGSRLINSKDELIFFLDRINEPIIQEYLPGPEITSDVINDFSGNTLGISCRQRLEVRTGEVAKGKTVYNKNVIDGCLYIAKKFSAIGPITVQSMQKDGVYHFTEINPRFGGGMPLGIASGVDAPTWIIAKYLNIPIQIPPIGSYKTDLYMSRFDTSFFLTSEQLEIIQFIT